MAAGAEVLADSSRDLKVLAIMGDVLLTAERPEDLAAPLAYLNALTRALGPYWSQLHPLPEAKNWVRIRQGLLAQMLTGLERLCHWALPTAPAANANDHGEQDAQGAGDQILTLLQRLAALDSFSGDWADTRRSLNEIAARLEAALIQQKAPPPPAPQQTTETRPAALPPRALRQRYLELADQLHGQNQGQDQGQDGALDQPLAYTLRRKAAFSTFEGEVQADGNVTALTDITPDRVGEVLAAAKAPTFGALAALESTLQTRALWLTGHRLAGEMALALAPDGLGARVAHAIHDAVRGEILALGDHVLNFTFKDGLPFADAPTKAWLQRDALAVPELRKIETPEPQEAEDALTTLNTQAEDRLLSERGRTLILANLAEALADQGHATLANAVAAHMEADLNGRGLLEWEIDLHKRIKSLIRSV